MQQKMRSRLWWSVGIMAVLIGVMVGTGLMLARTRQPFVSKADPVTGYRCAFTLSRNWVRSKEPLSVSSSGGEKTLDSVQYILTPPTPLQSWIEKHWGHPAASSPAYLKDYINRILIVLSQENPSSGMRVHDGYPEPDLKNSAPFVRMEEKRRFLLDGQPATQCKLVYDLGRMGAGKEKLAMYLLCIKVRDKPLYLMVGGFSDASHERTIHREIDAIRDSFRLEKPDRPKQ